MTLVISNNVFQKLSLEDKRKYFESLKHERDRDENFLKHYYEEKRKDSDQWHKLLSIYITLIFGLVTFANLTHTLFEIGIFISITSGLIFFGIIFNYFFDKNERKELNDNIEKLRKIIGKLNVKIEIVEEYILIETILKNKKLTEKERKSLENTLSVLVIKYVYEYNRVD